jgi:hypothetical protein
MIYEVKISIHGSKHGQKSVVDRLLLGFFFFFLGERVVRLAALDVSAFLDEVADLVGRHGELALRTDIQCGSDQKVVAPSHPLG